MISFKKLNIEDHAYAREFFSRDNDARIKNGTDMICDQVFGTTFFWRDFYQLQYAVTGESLILQATTGGTDMFSFPVGGDVASALSELKSYSSETGKALYFCFVSEYDLHYFNDVFDVVFSSEEPDWFDYVYLKTDIEMFSGRKYHTQKNHLNRFNKENPNGKFIEINESNLGLVRDYTNSWYTSFSDHTAMSEFEEAAIYDLLDNWNVYNMTGGYILSEKGISGFTVGEVVNDTVYIHVEKADHNVHGAYQFLSSEYLKSIKNENVIYVNREEDMGIIGLRKSKESLSPVKKLKKFTLYCY